MLLPRPLLSLTMPDFLETYNCTSLANTMMQKEAQSLQHSCHIWKGRWDSWVRLHILGKYKHGNKSPLFSSTPSSRIMNIGNKTTVKAKCDMCNKSRKIQVPWPCLMLVASILWNLNLMPLLMLIHQCMSVDDKSNYR